MQNFRHKKSVDDGSAAANQRFLYCGDGSGHLKSKGWVVARPYLDGPNSKTLHTQNQWKEPFFSDGYEESSIREAPFFISI
jgi:hypothetical protein